jgi:hypothetical protein
VNTDPDVEKSVTTDIVVIVQLAIASVTLSANGQLPPSASVPSALACVAASVPSFLFGFSRHSSGTRAGTHSKPFIRQPGFENASNDDAVANLMRVFG